MNQIQDILKMVDYFDPKTPISGYFLAFLTSLIIHVLINYAGLTSQLNNHTLRIITTKFHQDLMDQIQDT